MKKYKILIGDKWIDSGETIDVVNPYNGHNIAKVCIGGAQEIDKAIKSATKAFETTRTMSS